MSGAPQVLTVGTPFAIQQHGGAKSSSHTAGCRSASYAAGPAEPALVRALARAHRWKRQVESGRDASISEIEV